MPSASADEFGFSPSFLEFEFSGEDICKEIQLLSEKRVNVFIEDLWSDFPSTRVREYIQDEEFLNYTRTVVVDGKKSVTICNILQDGKKHYGLVIFSVENSSTSGGMWVRIKGDGDSLMPEKRSALSFTEHEIFLISSTRSSTYFSNIIVLIIMVESAVILSCILPILVLNSRR